MKLPFYSFMILFILLSCSHQIKMTKEKAPYEKAITANTTANYSMFKYIDRLTPDDYYSKLDSIKKDLTDDFFTLRMAYTKTSDFNPYDTDIADIYKSIVEAIHSSNYHHGLELADSILKHNYVDSRSHMYCGYIYKQLNDSLKSNYHNWCYEGLINSIKQSGDGRTARTAFIVITTKEEYGLLDWYNLQFKEQSLVMKDSHDFDILKAKDDEANEEYDIYFNIDIPFRSMLKMFDGK